MIQQHFVQIGNELGVAEQEEAERVDLQLGKGKFAGAFELQPECRLGIRGSLDAARKRRSLEADAV